MVDDHEHDRERAQGLDLEAYAARLAGTGPPQTALRVRCDTEPMLLYDSAISGNAYMVRLLLAHLGLACERQWLLFEQYSHKPNIAVPIFWSAYAADPPPEAKIEARRRLGYVALDAMQRHLTDRALLVGDRCTIADLSLYAYTQPAVLGGFELARYGTVRAWLDRVAAQPGHVPIDA